MRIVRGNSWLELENAPAFFRDLIKRHLAVPVDPKQAQIGVRFGEFFPFGANVYGSLVLQERYCAAGLAPHVVALAQHYGVPFEYRDARVRPMGGYPWHSLHVQWRGYQDRVHEACVEHGCGIIDAPPRSGKTNMAARLVDVHGVPAVYVAPSLPIVLQTYQRFVSWFGEDMVSRLDGHATEKERDLSKPIVIATAASAVRQPPEWWRTREMLLIDEFHHAAAETYHTINALAQHIYLRFMFTGTHFRTGEDGLAMEAVCSQVLSRVTLDELIRDGYLARPRVMFQAVGQNRRTLDEKDYLALYMKGVVENEERNQLVASTVGALRMRDQPTIVLTRRRAHADALGEMIPDSVVVKGGEQALTSKAVKDFAAGYVGVLIGTTVIGEGVDLPRAAALVYASGGNGGVGHMQSYFRPLTGHEGKAFGRIYDFWDASSRVLAEQSWDRFSYARQYLGDGNVILA